MQEKRAANSDNNSYTFFWQNIRENGGLRLNENGYRFLVHDLDLEKYIVDIREQKINFKFLLELDRFMDCPYFIMTGRWPKIILFSEQTYFWLSMHNQDFQSFLNAYKV
jgi:hypothetical protein|tara:strand:+ start:1028 stop:1354 length:327 start_codon:yes stop_codon:yes gene_type:complete